MQEKSKEFIRIQLKHKYYPESNPYPAELEEEMLKLSLPIIGWTEEDKEEAIIRHETGPEIILLLSSVINLGIELVKLFSLWKKKRPETKIQVTVNTAEELERVLNVLHYPK